MATISVGSVPRRGAIEHISHVRDLGGIPFTDRLIERGGGSEHVLHVRDLGGVPVIDRLIKCGSRQGC